MDKSKGVKNQSMTKSTPPVALYVDGNEAAASVAYRTNEVIAILSDYSRVADG